MAESPAVDRQRAALLRALGDAGALYVLIGGAALESHQQPHRTVDVDVAPARTPKNLEALAAVLNDLQCALVVDPADASLDVPLPTGYFTASNLGQQDVWNLKTRHGKLDIAFTPAGFPDGYDQLQPRAQRLTVAHTDVQVSVAALEDVEHSKRTAGRPKDLAYLQRVGRTRAPGRDERAPGSSRGGGRALER